MKSDLSKGSLGLATKSFDRPITPVSNGITDYLGPNLLPICVYVAASNCGTLFKFPLLTNWIGSGGYQHAFVTDL